MIIGKKRIFAKNRSPMKKFPDTDGATLCLTLVNDLRQVSLLTGFVDRVQEQNHLAPEFAARINLALEEAVCNVIQYAYPEGTAGKMSLEAVKEGKRLRFTLTDWGKVFDPTAVPQTDISLGLEERQVGGLGILLVRTIMDKVCYRRENGKNILKLTKNI
jgi:anti-sigma regulatory factor (Ser/Thr protein kinase)